MSSWFGVDEYPCDDQLLNGRQTGNYHWCANETCLKTDLTPSALFHQTNLTLPPLDPQSWILLIPIVSHVSECSTIRKAFALSRRDDNGAETSTRVVKATGSKGLEMLSLWRQVASLVLFRSWCRPQYIAPSSCLTMRGSIKELHSPCRRFLGCRVGSCRSTRTNGAAPTLILSTD